MINIYTDGACQGNPGPGGWAAVIVQDGRRTEHSGRVEGTTNNRMELQAAIEGLSRTPEGAGVVLHSDSQYLIYSMTRNWKRRVNTDLWRKLDGLVASRKVRWEWAEENADNPEIQRAHNLATQQAGTAKADPPLDLTHLDERGQARMVDVSAKPETAREAIARGRVFMQPETLKLLQEGKVEKGDALAVARLAGIAAAKETARLIPLAHPLPLTQVTVDLRLDDTRSAVDIEARAKTTARTGVEMEALVAVAVSALALYDMLKAADRAMRIEDIRLVRKSGGRSGEIVLEG
ncbi:MAG: cyclic pyranopterin monophosphate synthase MoaC [Chloroflexi bacterium]|nr:cyclic pyranopterin monophosphate synthase MoaC [Chloroflexota bacterium]